MDALNEFLIAHREFGINETKDVANVGTVALAV
jgi:hypothetical protein